MWSEARGPRRSAALAVGAASVLLLVLAGCSGDERSDADVDPAVEVLPLGEAAAGDGGDATVLAVEPDLEATAEVWSPTDGFVAVELEVCGDAEAVAGLWTLAIGDDRFEPEPLPDGALPGERPVLDFTSGPGPDGCRRGWVAWDVPLGDRGVLVWEGAPDVGWEAQG